jgi:hypothetical protein
MSNKSISDQLKHLDVRKLRTANGKKIEEELRRHARILANCIQMELDKVYESYEPKIYQRTYDLYNSLEVDQTVKVDISASGARLSIGVHFDDGAIHQSLSSKPSNMAWLINDGWQVKNTWFKNVPMFGYREATNFIEKGIEDYKKSVSNPFSVKLTKGDEIIYL